MSCDNNVSQLVYLLPLRKSIPDKKSNKEKKKAELRLEKKKKEYRKKVVDNNETERKVLVTTFEAPSLSQT